MTESRVVRVTSWAAVAVSRPKRWANMPVAPAVGTAHKMTQAQ